MVMCCLYKEKQGGSGEHLLATYQVSNTVLDNLLILFHYIQIMSPYD